MKAEFYKMDFRAWDIGTVDLTLEQEAAYLRLCHAMYSAHGPVPNSIRLLCSLFRCGNAKAAALLRALIEAGKVQITEGGMLSNRRVSAELADRAQISVTRSEAGERGGRARRRDARESTDCRVIVECPPTDCQVIGECPPTDTGVIGANPLIQKDVTEANASTPESREEKRREEPPVAPNGGEPDRFPEFRSIYPRRSTAFPTTLARKRWNEAIRRGAAPADIISGARLYAAEQSRIGKIGTEFVKCADSWLHQQRWGDYAAASEPMSPPTAAITDATWRDRVRSWRERGGHWPWKGPPPDERGTHVPPAILAEFCLAKLEAA